VRNCQKYVISSVSVCVCVGGGVYRNIDSIVDIIYFILSIQFGISIPK